MVSFTVLSGGYDAFVAAYAFSSDNGSLALTSQSPTGEAPSWITISPFNSSIVYATNEVDQGAVQSFIASPDGSLSPAIANVSSGGAAPAFATILSTNELAVFDYNSGTGRILAVGDDFVSFTGDGNSSDLTFPVPFNGSSHPHEAFEYQGEVFVPDLGADTIYRLSETDGTWSITGDIPQPEGSGPRHIFIQDDYLYTLHELSSTLSVQRVPAGPNGTSDVLSSVYIVPDAVNEGSFWQAGEILIPANTTAFPTSYIYVSNRNTGTVDPEAKGDSIAIYEHVNKGQDGEELQLINQVYTGLEQVRGMEVAEVCEGGEKYLVAAGVAGTAGVKVFERTEEGRNLVEVANNTEVETRTSFAFLCDA